MVADRRAHVDGSPSDAGHHLRPYSEYNCAVGRVAEGSLAYLWFHTFPKRATVAEVISVLRDGPTPRPGSGTQRNEAALGIAPPCVYAYLGQPNEAFGECAFCIPSDALAHNGGVVSPFDTGGLVEHLIPTKDWEPDSRSAYLRIYSWPAEDLDALLERYPTSAREKVAAYLRGEKPAHAGPHEVFERPGESESELAAIWENASNVRAWLWEGRVPHRMPVARLLHWSCSTSTYQEIRRYAETIEDEGEAMVLEELLARYVPGGPSVLCFELRAMQEAAA